MVFPKELYNGIPNVTVWGLLRKSLYLKAYTLSIDQGDVSDFRDENYFAKLTRLE
jgi:hypothetical protein